MIKNNLLKLSFVSAGVGFVFIVLSLLDIKSTSYQYYTGIAFMFLIISVVTRAIAKRKMKQAKPEV
jgi:Na+-transporting methylmalonyl-CoA/oxaloacetate decarboxylase gamma subunit